MSRINEILEQNKQKIIEIHEHIKETEIYQKLSEKYDSLTPSGQKMARYSAAFIFVFLLVFHPVSQVQYSSSVIAEFEEKRNLLKDLFKTYRESHITNLLPQAPEPNELLTQIQSTLSSSHLLPTQIIAVTPSEPDGVIIPTKLTKHVVQVQLSQLNIKQIVDIGTRLTNVSGSIKLKDVIIDASPENSGYFNVTYKIYALNVPATDEQVGNASEPSKNKNNSKMVDE